ncbi:universal stress protein (plasmid) [Agrobacterium vitis]|uniref:universal stress protein n=1 Tax=Agrobacterium vitis TaxID=373 RepID=UPI003D2AAAD4
MNIAVELARSSGAYLWVLLLGIAAAPPTGEFAENDAIAWLKERDLHKAKLAEKAAGVKDILQRADVAHDVIDIYTEWTSVNNVVAHQARYADIIAIGPDTAADGPLKHGVVDGALFHSDVPVLLIPRDAKPTLKPATVVVAWKDSLEAARAVKEGIELLKSAKAVHVGMVDPDRYNGDPTGELGPYLLRHGVAFNSDILRSDGRTVVETLDQYADDVAADMIIMGAYSHSRMRERIFGGVTLSVLENPKRPVFFAR